MKKNRSFYLFRRGEWLLLWPFIDSRRPYHWHKKHGGKGQGLRSLDRVADWVKNGIPDKANNARYSPNVVCDLEMIIKSIKKAEIGSAGAIKIVSALKQMGLVTFNVCEGNGGEC